MSAERAQRLHRLARALEARRRLAGLRRAALEAEIAACDGREIETLAFAETAPADGALGRALTRRLATIDGARATLRAEREAVAERARRDRRLSRGVEHLAGRLDEEEGRRLEQAALEAWIDATLGRPAASLPPASTPSFGSTVPKGSEP